MVYICQINFTKMKEEKKKTSAKLRTMDMVMGCHFGNCHIWTKIYLG